MSVLNFMAIHPIVGWYKVQSKSSDYTYNKQKPYHNLNLSAIPFAAVTLYSDTLRTVFLIAPCVSVWTEVVDWQTALVQFLCDKFWS